MTWLLRALESFLYRRADCIISVLPNAHEYIESRGIPAERIVWIPNGVDLSRPLQGDSAVSQGSPFRVLYVGAHGEANALGTLLSAARVVQERGGTDIRFVLVGDGPENQGYSQRRRT